ncbi:stalk domain-containing protein [Tissierella praeacuta]|uniref:stalk domain-containing protein n=1 Tax=Tissierella praeacuta TaxID=43131 RepID=UPI003341E0E6
MRKYIKNLSLFALILVTILGLNQTIYANKILTQSPKQTQAVITIDGKEVKFNNDMGYPLITNTQRILIPVRIVSENMGYNVDWSKDTWSKCPAKIKFFNK